MSLKNDPAVVALIEKATAKAAKEERNRILAIAKEVRADAGDIEDPAVRKTVKTILGGLIDRAKEPAEA